MKYIALMFSLFIVSTNCKAQELKPGYKTIQKDTINIRGYILDYEGKPIINARINSRASDLIFDSLYISASTNKSGYFELPGAKMNDTLSVSAGVDYGRYFNKGARYMVITMPPPSIYKITGYRGPAVITAKRKTARVVPSFQIQKSPYNEQIISYSPQHAEFQGAFENFIEYIKARLKYPQQAIDANIEGKIEAVFTVNADGTLSNIKIINGLGYSCDEDLLNIIKSTGKWKPAVMLGHACASTYSVSVDFKLTDQ